jgi:hypothetical protein
MDFLEDYWENKIIDLLQKTFCKLFTALCRKPRSFNQYPLVLHSKIVRFPKQKSKEVEAMKLTLKNQLGNDQTTNVAAVINLLKELYFEALRRIRFLDL